MALVRLRNSTIGFGGPPVLDRVDLSIESGERICLLGRNGTGKSTLMKLIAGRLKADSGDFEIQQGLVVAELDQAVPDGFEGTIFDVVSEGLGDIADKLRAFHHATARLAVDPNPANVAALDRAQHEVDAADGWQFDQRVASVLSRMQLDGELAAGSLSGGMKRRILLAQAMVRQPDLLLLDEPTNHLDIAAIDWLEQQLLAFRGAVLFVTHDRAFLRRLATRIIDLDRGRLTSYPGDYDNFLRRKQEQLDAEATANALFDRKLSQEEAWIRQGIKARRTRNEGRVRELLRLREQRLQRRTQQGRAQLQLARGERSGRLVAEAEAVSYRYGGEELIRDFSATVLRGDRIGIIGPNGVGKTTLLRLLLGELQPQRGTVRIGTQLSVAYFDQLKATFDESASLIDNITEGRERVEIGGSSRHVIGYLQDFLFSPEQSRAPVQALSGGERSRLLLARLFSKPANVLVFDEPTNDLDIETLEMLEERLIEFDGTILIVSHDRAFLNNVVTSTLVFEGDGRIAEFVGGYDDWERQRTVNPFAPEPVASQRESAAAATGTVPAGAGKAGAQRPGKKLGYRDRRELDALPVQIESLERSIAALEQRMHDPEFFRREKDAIAATTRELEELRRELDAAYARWEELESGA